MPKQKHEPDDPPAATSGKPPRSRKKRIAIWLAKAFGWLLMMAVLGVLLISLVAWFAYQNRALVANFALSKISSTYRFELEAIEYPERGKVVIDGLFLTPKNAPEDARPTRIERLEVTFDPATIRKTRKVDSITMSKPVIRIDDRALAALGVGDSGGKTEKSENAGVSLDFLGKFTDSFEVRDGKLEVDLDGRPPMELDWKFRTEALDMSSAKWMTEEPMRLRFENLNIGENAEFGSIDEIALDLLLSPDFARIEVVDFSVLNPAITVTPELVSGPEAADESIAETNQQDTVDEPTLSDRKRPASAELKVNRVRLEGGDFSVREFAAVPDVDFETGFDWGDFQWGSGMFFAGEQFHLRLEDVRIDGSAAGDADVPLARLNAIDLRGDWLEILHLKKLNSIVLESPDVVLTADSIARFGGEGKKTEVEPESAPGEPWTVETVRIQDGIFLMRDLGEAPGISSKLTADLSGVKIGGEAGFDAEIVLNVSDFVMQGPGAESASLVTIPTGTLEFQLSELLDERGVKSLKLDQPVVEVTDASLGDWANPDDSGDGEEKVEPEAPIWIVGDLAIDNGTIVVDTQLGGGQIPKVGGNFSIQDDPEVSSDPENPGYRVHFTGVRLRNHAKPESVGPAPERPPLGGLFPTDPDPTKPVIIRGIAEKDVAFVRDFTLDLTATGVQREQRIERVQVKGGTVKIGDGLKTMAEKQEPADNPEEPKPDDQPQAAVPSETGWKIGEVQVTESKVVFEAMIPQIEGLEFAIETTIKDVDLTGEGLLNNTEKQKIELTGIEIMDPYDGFIRVAQLPTVFVEFTLAGLMEQRIEKIDLLGPVLYVGQGLFWWMDYQKEYRAQNEGVSIGLEEEILPDVEADPDWEIGTIQAHYGKIIVAPVGYPVGIVPFPFEATTNMEKGEIALHLEIPDEQYVYEFPDFKVQLYGLKGEIDFNVPIKQEDNNLVQTFTLDRAVWKQFDAEEVYLTVTYDSEGIYGRFGGKAYDGYAEGQFNIYLNETGKWDAWMSGTGMDTKALTEVIAPDSFVMEGKVNAKIVSEGVGLEFGETTGDFQILEPGRFNVTRLEKVIEELPEEWSVLQRSGITVALETIKDFDYTKGSGDLYFLNRDGWLRLKLEGGTGNRKLNINVHDWRGKPVKKVENDVAEAVEE
ncbi:MAG: hypothetical protein HKN23_01735 [Verrucomicrobiales bacterium]|nr:hypothetical protein [Verrucomicrobiales bacterium]